MADQTPMEVLNNAIDNQEARALETIEKFKADLDKNPVYAMEWADNVFEAAADLKEALLARMGVNAVNEGKIEVSKMFVEIQNEMKLDLVRKLSGSTSPSHNLMALAKNATAGKWFEQHPSWSNNLARYVYRVSNPDS